MSCALFLPEFQKGMRFRYLGKQSSRPSAHVIVFSQFALYSTISARVTLDNVDALYPMQGIVWVDLESYQVARMITDIPETNSGTGLSRLSSEISYGRMQFTISPKVFWLPREVVITSVYRNGIYRNIHRYSDYKLFTVESHEERKPLVK